ncbi:MAG: SPASM domain-containing protein [Ignavibacteria bacterium]
MYRDVVLIQDINLGNILEESLEKIWTESSVLKKFRNKDFFTRKMPKMFKS